MFGWLDCCNSYSDSVYEEFEEEEEFNTFSLPSPLPPWPKGVFLEIKIEIMIRFLSVISASFVPFMIKFCFCFDHFCVLDFFFFLLLQFLYVASASFMCSLQIECDSCFWTKEFQSLLGNLFCFFYLHLFNLTYFGRILVVVVTIFRWCW